MEDCLFCKIMKGEIPAKTIYEDEMTKVFLDIDPNTNGHLLIVPKAHQQNIFDIDELFITNALKLIRTKLYPMLKEKLNCDGLTILQNNDYGQEIKHFHIHLIPRYKNDEYNIISNKEILDNIDVTYSHLTEK